MKRSARILLIDDSADDRALAVLVLRNALPGAEIVEAASALRFAEALWQSVFDLVITEYRLHWANGLAILRTLKAHRPECPVIMFTSASGDDMAVNALRLGLNDYLRKTTSGYIKLATAVQTLLTRSRTGSGAQPASQPVPEPASQCVSQPPEPRLQRLLDRINVGSFRCTLNGQLLEANPVLLHLLGIESLQESQAPAIQALLQQTLASPGRVARLKEVGYVHNEEVEMRRTDGQVIWAIIAEALSTQPSGDTVIDGLLQDISDRKKAEQELEQRAAELARSNADLEQFAYVASHDLQQPLRMVVKYTEMLRQRYAGRLDSDADEFISYALEGAKGMQALINDLLTYSRVGTRGKPFESTDMEIVFEQVAASLRPAIDASGAALTRDSLPTVLADASQMVQLLQNLINNAIKFHGREPPHVHVSSEKNNDEWVFSVQDNGIGIDPKDVQRIFVIFQRLHTDREYSGTGIGLAVCKKIVERHGGRIWVKSRPGKGSTFQFTILLKDRR